MDQQPEMLLPFEFLGVDTTWEFSMAKAANQIDYSTIADVLITMEYTALNSYTYRQQVIQELDGKISADRPFSFRHQFADQWYDLHNPGQTATQIVVRFKTRREDFPPNVQNLKVQHVVLYFAGTLEAAFEMEGVSLHFTEQQKGPIPKAVGGSANSIDGIISTRKGNGSPWSAIQTRSPFGEWELALPNTKEVTGRFKNGQLEDMFVLTYSGHTPDWPV
jgi:hypothetical protein